MTRRDSQPFTTQKIQEDNKIEIRKTKDSAVDQVLGDLKRDIPDFKIEREELIKALDINYKIRSTLDICYYIEFLRFYLWYKYNIEYFVYKYIQYCSLYKTNPIHTEIMLNDFLEKEISKHNEDIIHIIPRLNEKLSTYKHGRLIDDIINYKIGESDKNKSLRDLIVERTNKMKDTYTKRIMETYGFP